MTYEELYACLSLLTGMTKGELDAVPIDDLELALDFARAAALKWVMMRSPGGYRPLSN